MGCKKNVITRVPNILKCQKAFWFLSFSLCSESTLRNAWRVFSVIYRGSLKAHQLPVLHGICKNASCVRKSFTTFCLQLWTSRGFFPALFPLFLTRYSGCCTFNQHTGLFLQCTIKELFLCLTPLLSLLWSGGVGEICFLSAGCRQGGNGSFGRRGGVEDSVGWAQMAGKTVHWQGRRPRESLFHLDLHWSSCFLRFLPSLVGCAENEVL